MAPAAAPRDPRDEMPEHLPAMRAFALSLTRNSAQADDLVHDTIVKAWSKLDKFAPGSNLRAWLFTILRNTFYSDKRKSRREVADPGGIHAATLYDKPSHDGRLAFNDFSAAFDKLTPEHREVPTRISSLATIHRGLYQTTGLADISAGELLEDIVRQVVAIGSGPGRRFTLKTAFDDIRLTPDQAVPLSLLVTEILTNAQKYAASPAGAPPLLDVSLRRVGLDEAVLEVRNPVAGPVSAARGEGLGAQLIDAFAHRLGGRIARDSEAGTFGIRVSFAPSALAEAEERHRHRPNAAERVAC